MNKFKYIIISAVLSAISFPVIAQSTSHIIKKDETGTKSATIYTDDDFTKISGDIGISRFLLNGQTICNGNNCYVYYHQPIINPVYPTIPVYGGYLVPKPPRHPGKEEVKYMQTPSGAKVINIDMDDAENKEDDINVLYIKRPDGTKARYIEINDF